MDEILKQKAFRVLSKIKALSVVVVWVVVTVDCH